ncbi:uncharacterized protein LY79DRAFT_523604 [Colletotrichum navitas]|uniref:Zn(2)-C6 fungal-type domain-containing protein n=1 Tax=Colletotrichum navitas TaxID=681940 RepID=A0AAD8PRK3_9PEZI|nr:uncharacterized protein LY79DRAFT_523604 [Colletotrichum navitas]KAK1574608.1 hypothetical protein LY79DRAFT_523604 [Colletotrichum navitas]
MADNTGSGSGSGAGTGTGPPRQRRQRTRTGCLKCRIRRRKCDERKPRCQRCIDGDFECQYGSRLTFLDKNALTVSPAPDAGDASTPRYSKLQFVDPASPNQTAKPSSPPSPVSQDPPNPSITTNAADIPACLSPSQTPAPPVSTFQIDPQLSDPPVLELQHLEPRLAPTPFHHPLPLTQWRSQSICHESLASPAGKFHITDKPPGISASNDAAYETALNALLSPGNEGTDLDLLPSHGSESHAVAGDGFRLSPQELISASPNLAGERRTPPAMLPLTAASISPDRLLQLLRHFRYQVAPWLDLCDMSQTFGLHVPRLAIENEGVLHSLLAVAAVAQQADASSTALSDVEHLKSLAGARPMHPEGGVSMSDGDLVHLALWTACQFTSSVPDEWQDLLGITDDNFWSGVLAEVTPKTIVILSVLIRLELAAALVTGAPISVPERLHYGAMSQPWDSSPIAETMFRCTVEPLLLCAQVVNFCASASRPHTAVGPGTRPTPVHRWTVLSDALGAWYANRAQEFWPMAEMDGEESLFPVILFTNGAAVFANQLYHTAMLLLLRNKPRVLQTAAAAAKKPSAAAPLSSPLWHAQRVCGIALNNDRRDSWDLCLVASLYLAAQRMTYEPQQRAVLECFERVGALTGWHVDGFSAKAREDWGLM